MWWIANDVMMRPPPVHESTIILRGCIVCVGKDTDRRRIRGNLHTISTDRQNLCFDNFKRYAYSCPLTGWLMVDGVVAVPSVCCVKSVWNWRREIERRNRLKRWPSVQSLGRWPQDRWRTGLHLLPLHPLPHPLPRQSLQLHRRRESCQRIWISNTAMAVPRPVRRQAQPHPLQRWKHCRRPHPLPPPLLPHPQIPPRRQQRRRRRRRSIDQCCPPSLHPRGPRMR